MFVIRIDNSTWIQAKYTSKKSNIEVNLKKLSRKKGTSLKFVIQIENPTWIQAKYTSLKYIHK